GGSCRRCASCGGTRRALRQLEPDAVVAPLDLVRVADGLEDALQVEPAFARLRRLERVGRERPERGVEDALGGGEDDGHLAVVVAEPEHGVERDLEILEVVEREVVMGGEPAGDEVRDRPEVLFGRDDEPDLVAAHTVPASRSSVSRSSSRRAAASLPACTAWRQSRRALKSAAPKLTPAAKPETFWTGRVMARLTARTAVSTLSAASTALSVMRSTLSSCPFTRSTLPPTLPITGRSDCS